MASAIWGTGRRDPRLLDRGDRVFAVASGTAEGEAFLADLAPR